MGSDTADEVATKWKALVSTLDAHTGAFYRDCRPTLEGKKLLLTYWYPWHHARAGENLEKIKPLLPDYFGNGIEISIALNPEIRNQKPSRPTPAITQVEPGQVEIAPSVTPSLRPTPVWSADGDPLVKELANKLKAQVINIDIVEIGMA